MSVSNASFTGSELGVASGLSRMVIVGDPDTVRAILANRRVDLRHPYLLTRGQSIREIIPLPPGTMYANPALVATFDLTPGWKRMGMLMMEGISSSTRVQDRLELLSSQEYWIFHFDWNPAVGDSAWDILLRSQDTLRPRGWSLSPNLLLPVCYLARMGSLSHWPTDGDNAWFPHLAYAYERSIPLLEGLFSAWIVEGKSEKAAQMRSAMPVQARRLPPDLKPVVKRFSALFGDDRLNAILHAERPEPAIIRALDETSVELWRGTITGVSTRDAWVAGLLLPALWRPDPPGPADEIAKLAPEEVGEAWQQFLRGK